MMAKHAARIPLLRKITSLTAIRSALLLADGDLAVSIVDCQLTLSCCDSQGR